MKIKDKEFELFIDSDKIEERVSALASEIENDYKDRNPLFIVVLNGAFMFASDLLKRISIPCTISFIKLSSYEKTSSSGEVKQLLGLNENIYGKHVVILEDIIDTGYTIQSLLKMMDERGAKSVESASLLIKPEMLKTKVNVKYLGFEIPSDFVIGYGMDYDGEGRNKKDIYKIKSN